MENFLYRNIKHLRKTKGLTQEQFADKIGVNRAMIGSYEEGRAVPRLQSLQFMSQYFGISIDDLINTDLSAEGDQNVSANHLQGKQLRVLTTIVDRNDKELITLIPQKATAGYLSGYADVDYIETMPRLALPLTELSKERTYRAFQITGDSMEPVPSGSYIICEYVQNWLDLKEGKSYIVVTSNDGIVYKRVYFQDDKRILLKSDNYNFKPYTIETSDLLELWRSVGYICLTLPEPDELTLSKLAMELISMKKEISEIKRMKE